MPNLNENRYLSPFRLEYWRQALQETRSLRSLVIAALLSAISIAMGALFIPVGESLRVYFSFIPRALLGMICGPIVGPTGPGSSALASASPIWSTWGLAPCGTPFCSKRRFGFTPPKAW